MTTLQSTRGAVAGGDPATRRFFRDFLILALAIGGTLLLSKRQALTGDEPRYFMFARSFIEHGRFVMTLPQWQHLYRATTGLEAASLPVGYHDVALLNGVYLPAVLAPVSLAGLAALRLATLLAGLLGLACLLGLARRTGSGGAAWVATLVAGLSIPLLPYLHIFYMETFLFALLCAAWWRLQTPTRNTLGDVVTGCLLLALPFVHLRAAVVAVVLYGLLLWQVCMRGQWLRAAALVALAAAALAVLVTANLSIYGTVTGPVNTARPPLPSEWFGVLSMQLFNVRHGLLAFAPVWLLGYAGLVAGALRGSRLARQGLVLAAIAAVTGVGVNPGECWPARFWVLSIPMLAVGLCLWWQMARTRLPRILALSLIAFTLLNSYAFLKHPNDLLENRQSGTTYQAWFDKVGHLDFGLPLPVETDDPIDRTAATTLAIGSLLFVAFAIAAPVRGPAWTTGCFLLLLAALDAAHVRLVPPAQYRVEARPDRLTLVMQQPMAAGYVQLGRPWLPLFGPPQWPRFDVEADGALGQSRHFEAARNVVPVSCKDGIRSVTIATRSAIDLADAAHYRMRLYRSQSMIWRTVGWLRDRC